MDRSSVSAALAVVGRQISQDGWKQLTALDRWLRTEAATGGGIGLREVGRIEARHLADSVLFAKAWCGQAPPGTLLDIGSGAGLPGLVLAIVFPETSVTLLDRSEKRTDLSGRAVRVLGLGNVQVVQRDIATHADTYAGVVMRAVFPPPAAIPVLAASMGLSGTGVLGLSRTAPPSDVDAIASLAAEFDCEAHIVELRVLDLLSWVLIMTRS